jgi:hypothetical protein
MLYHHIMTINRFKTAIVFSIIALSGLCAAQERSWRKIDSAFRIGYDWVRFDSSLGSDSEIPSILDSVLSGGTASFLFSKAIEKTDIAIGGNIFFDYLSNFTPDAYGFYYDHALLAVNFEARVGFSLYNWLEPFGAAKAGIGILYIGNASGPFSDYEGEAFFAEAAIGARIIPVRFKYFYLFIEPRCEAKYSLIIMQTLRDEYFSIAATTNIGFRFAW